MRGSTALDGCMISKGEYKMGDVNGVGKAPVPVKNTQIRNNPQTGAEKIKNLKVALGDDKESVWTKAADDLAKIAINSSPSTQQQIADEITDVLQNGTYHEQMGAANVAQQLTQSDKVTADVKKSFIKPLANLMKGNNVKMNCYAKAQAVTAFGNIAKTSGISPENKSEAIEAIMSALADENENVQSTSTGALSDIVESPNILMADRTKAFNALRWAWNGNGGNQSTIGSTLAYLATSPNVPKFLQDKCPQELKPKQGTASL
jgi:hypothetical protein